MLTLKTLLASLALAGNPLLCDDLSAIAPTPRVDYPTEIQPIFDRECSICHGFSGGLSLEEFDGYEHLYCQLNQGFDSPAGELRVLPFDPAESWLFLRINCDGNAGFRMPRGAVLSTSDQALVRDWIAQGARPDAEDLFRGSFENDETCAAPLMTR